MQPQSRSIVVRVASVNLKFGPKEALRKKERSWPIYSLSLHMRIDLELESALLSRSKWGRIRTMS
jgi:hypothetical protein